MVTGGRDRLRFESFSGCCGVYARLDVAPDGLDGDIVAHGTTNVDVNPPLRDALARVGGLDPLHLSVGPDDLTVSTMDSSVVERKVPLPRRWLRGFAEVQVIAAGMDLLAEIPAVEAATLLRRLPGAGDRSVLWAVPAGRSLRLTSRAAPGAVCLSGAGRLAALRGLLRHASALRVYGPPVAAGAAPTASVWELDLAGMSLSLTLSPEPARGFLRRRRRPTRPGRHVRPGRRPGARCADAARHRRSGRLRPRAGRLLPPGAALRSGPRRAGQSPADRSPGAGRGRLGDPGPGGGDGARR
ncbi:hypothetical protein [Micromonospora sp. Llam0]|uniref:hypothetical protein n=1 Tax=Micromonospora sp. Llam0 TaxID=2485143 RepID=UPI001F224D33|nr:hypothetical protein [Micromonospora sp. Llam0]